LGKQNCSIVFSQLSKRVKSRERLITVVSGEKYVDFTITPTADVLETAF